MNPLLIFCSGLFGVSTGIIGILSYIGADTMTTTGINPLDEDGSHISFDVCQVDSTIGNYGLLILGGIAALLAFYLGRSVNPVLRV